MTQPTLALGKALHLLLLITSTPQNSPKQDKLKKEASNLIHQHNNALGTYLEYNADDTIDVYNVDTNAMETIDATNTDKFEQLINKFRRTKK